LGNRGFAICHPTGLEVTVMRSGSTWLLAGEANGAADAVLVTNSDSEPEYAMGYDGVDQAAEETIGWDVKPRFEGKMASVARAVKEGVGQFTGDADLESEGSVERIAGRVKDVAG
jgi:uncharacterized protein YjbJ (UPF0337 family)